MEWIDQFYSYMQIDSRALKLVFKRSGYFFSEMRHVGVRGQIQDGGGIELSELNEMQDLLVYEAF